MVRGDGGAAIPSHFQNVRKGHSSVVSRGEVVAMRASQTMEAGAHSFVWCTIILEQYFTLYMF